MKTTIRRKSEKLGIDWKKREPTNRVRKMRKKKNDLGFSY
jgi:hypothetical protein